MPRETVVLQVFVASPSDVSDERGALETVIAQLNQVWSRSLGITFELIRWETNVHPSFSSDPQAVINEQIDVDYDVFIGIFWGRLGTPTPREESGTIEEFERAYTRFQRTKELPEIMLYFKDAPISPSKIDARQLQALQEFKDSVAPRGGIYSVFEDQAGFESSLRAHLAAIAQKFSSQRRSTSTAVLAPNDPRTEDTPEISSDDDYGIIDYIEIYEARMADMNSAITLINEATVRVGEQLNQRSVEINSGIAIDPKAARRLIKRAADDMNIYADTLNSQVSLLSTSRKVAFDSLTNSLALRGEFRGQEQDLHTLRQTLASLIDSTSAAKSGMSGMRAAANGLPRISKELNQAKRSVVSRLDLFLSEIDSISSTVANIVEAIDRMLGDASGQ
jgi:hypothetical protein